MKLLIREVVRYGVGEHQADRGDKESNMKLCAQLACMDGMNTDKAASTNGYDEEYCLYGSETRRKTSSSSARPVSHLSNDLSTRYLAAF